jgi:hypothetical protein
VDLNFLYSQHQIALIRSDSAGNPQARDCHASAARSIAGQIERFQRGMNAPASQAWATAS